MYDISSVVISFICQWNIRSQIPTWPKIVVWWPAALISIKTFSPNQIYLYCLVYHNSYHCTVNLKHGKLDKTKNITSNNFIYYKIFLFVGTELHELLSKTSYDTFLLAQTVSSVTEISVLHSVCKELFPTLKLGVLNISFSEM